MWTEQILDQIISHTTKYFFLFISLFYIQYIETSFPFKNNIKNTKCIPTYKVYKLNNKHGCCFHAESFNEEVSTRNDLSDRLQVYGLFWLSPFCFPGGRSYRIYTPRYWSPLIIPTQLFRVSETSNPAVLSEIISFSTYTEPKYNELY